MPVRAPWVRIPPLPLALRELRNSITIVRSVLAFYSRSAHDFANPSKLVLESSNVVHLRLESRDSLLNVLLPSNLVARKPNLSSGLLDCV